MDELIEFRKSSNKLVEFLKKWAKPLDEKCRDSNASSQQKGFLLSLDEIFNVDQDYKADMCS